MASSGPTASAGARSRVIGFGLALAASLGLGLAVAFARIAFEGGTDGQSVATVRAWFVVLVVGLWCIVSGRGLGVDRRTWLHCLGLGTLLAYMFFGNIGAVKYIPVGVAALLFFVYPPLIAVFTAYAFVTDAVAAGALYVIDHAFFAIAIAMRTYFQKIADPADIAPTAGVAFTINHIAAIGIPVGFGLLWLVSPAAVFLAGAAMAIVSLFLARLVPAVPVPGNEVDWSLGLRSRRAVAVEAK